MGEEGGDFGSVQDGLLIVNKLSWLGIEGGK